MILENTGLSGASCDLAHFDTVSEQLGFVRWQWEYYRATYDLKIEDKVNHADFYVRLSTRAIEGKLESPDAILVIESVYVGKSSFPHGLDYESAVPEAILSIARKKLDQLKVAIR